MRRRAKSFAAVVLAGCASFPEVRPSEKHGTLHIRVVHRESEYTFDDRISLDGATPVSMGRAQTRERSVRVAPGTHRVVLRSSADRYELRDVTVPTTVNHCIGVTCAPIRSSERRTELVPVQWSECTSWLEVSVPWRAQALALFVVNGEGRCEGCLPRALEATDCEGEPPLAPQP